MENLMKHRGEILRALANNHYDVREDGAILLGAGINAIPMGNFDHIHRRMDPEKLARTSALRRLMVESPVLRGIGRTRGIGAPARALRRWGKQGTGDVIGRAMDSNILPLEGLNHILSVILNNGSKVSPWLLALFEGNYTPVAGLTAATFTAAATECIAYDETARVEFVEGAPAGGVIANTASRAIFTMNATKTIYGGALLSTSAKSSTSGVLLAAARFGTAREVIDDDELAVKYTLTLTSS